MNNAFKVKKFMKLTLQEELIYSLISCYSDRFGVSHITRQCLMDKTGIKKADTITKHTNRLQELGLIKKTYEYIKGKKYAIYRVMNPQKEFIWVSNSIFKVNPMLAAFLIKLADLRLTDSNKIKISKNQIAKHLGIGKATLYKYLKLAELDSMLSFNEEEIILSSEYFPIFNKVSESTKNKINHLLESDKAFKGRKVFLDYYKNNFANLKCSIDYFVDYCLAGCPSIKKENKQEEINILI